MKWLKTYRVQLLVVLLHCILLVRLLVNAYEIERVDFFALSFTVLNTAVPALLVGAGLVGLVRDRKAPYLLIALVGGLILWRVYRYDPERIVDSIRLINDKLSASRPLLLRDFAYLIDSISLLLAVLSFLTLAIYPWNLLITDLAFLLFLWAVDSLPNKEAILAPFVFFWGFLFVHERILSRDARYGAFRLNRINRRSRMLQGLVITFLIGALALPLIRDTKGSLYEKIWMRANNYLMQDNFLSGRNFIESFSLARTGYHDSSTRLGGNVNPDERVAMRVGEDVPTYLRGNTKYTYTGRIWEKSDLVYRTDHLASDLAVSAYGSAPLRQMTIIPESLVSSSLFVSAYPRSVIVENRTKDNRIYYGVQDQTFMVAEAQRDPYRVEYFDQTSVEGTAMSRAGSFRASDYERYLDVPDTITQRTYDLVAELTEGLESQTDKMIVITEYLRENYEYTLRPGSLPPGEDFVDHFLFEDREGYCVHYGTALTVMLRIAGIPARYAEGFKVPEETDEEGYALVRNSDAHAWAEVLTDGDGDVWTIWDATGTARDHENFGENTGSNPDPSTTPVTGQTAPTRTLTEDTLPDPSANPGAGPDPSDDGTGRLPHPLWLIPAALALLAAAAGWNRLRLVRLINKEDDSGFLAYLVRLMQESGVESEESETLHEISERILDKQLQGRFSAYADQHYAARYSAQTAAVAPAVRGELLEEVWRVHRAANPAWRHFWRRYVR